MVDMIANTLLFETRSPFDVVKVSWKVWEYLEVNEFQYYITRCNQYQVPSHEEIKCLDEFTKEL